jgi:ATP-dependent protease ClpP protease subunit
MPLCPKAVGSALRFRLMAQLNSIITPRNSTPNKQSGVAGGQSLEKIEKDVERDFIMSPQQAKEYGLIDEIIHKRG